MNRGNSIALAAVREAMGFGPEISLEVRGSGLPEVDLRPKRDEIIAAALRTRPELVRANVLVEVTCLEVEAQGSSHHKKKETFASGSDIHATQVPQTEQNSQYRPGGVPPEMPGQLVGSRNERVMRAQAYHEKAQAVLAVTRNLISLEADDAFLRWEEAALQTKAAREAADTGEAMARDLNKDFTAGLKVKVEDVINAWVLASQARAQYNEALYKQLLALADLQRVTAGAFNPRLAELTLSESAPKQDSQKKDDKQR